MYNLLDNPSMKRRHLFFDSQDAFKIARSAVCYGGPPYDIFSLAAQGVNVLFSFAKP